MVRSKCFLISTILGIFSLTHKEEEVWPDGTHPMLFVESSCVCIPSFRFVAPFFFSSKSTTFGFFSIDGGVAI